MYAGYLVISGLYFGECLFYLAHIKMAAYLSWCIWQQKVSCWILYSLCISGFHPTYCLSFQRWTSTSDIENVKQLLVWNSALYGNDHFSGRWNSFYIKKEQKEESSKDKIQERLSYLRRNLHGTDYSRIRLWYVSSQDHKE